MPTTHIRRITLCVTLCLCAVSARAQQALDFGPLEQVARDELQQTRTPGAAVAIVSGDRVVFVKGFGTSNIETNAPVTPDMLFRLGSTTKMFTAAALLMLAEQHRINLHDPIGRYVASLHPQIARVTAHQLLSHTSGMFDEAPMFGSSDEDALAKEVRSWTGNRFFTEPGLIYSYSNPGYWTAGFLIEVLSGKRYADQMSEGVFKPLGMSKTTLRPLVAITYPLARGHELAEDKPVVVRPAANNAASWPAGSIFSSVNDLSRFVIAFLNDGRLDGAQVLPPPVIARLQQGNVTIPGGENKYGYGLNIGTLQGLRIVQHGGSRSGYGSTIRMVPERRFGVIIVANRTGASLGRTANTAMEIALGVRPDPERSRMTQTLTDEEMNRYVGVYAQGPRTMEILKKDGKLFLKQGARERALDKVGDQELASGSTRIVIVAGSGDAEYLHSGGRSWKKIMAVPR